MTTYALRQGTRRALAWPAYAWVLLAVVVAWSLVWIGLILNVLPQFVFDLLADVDVYLLLFLPPVILALVVALSDPERNRPLRIAATVTAVVAAAMGIGALVVPNPALVAAPPAVLVAALACARWPAGAVVFAFLLTGSFNTLEAFTSLPAGPMVDLVLAGLWAGTIWVYAFGSRDRPAWLWPGVAVSVLYLCVTALQISSSEGLYVGLYAFRVTAWYMLAFLLLAYSPLVARHYERIARGLVLACLAIGGYALFRWLVPPTGPELDRALSGAWQYNYIGGELRLFGSLPSGHHLGAWMGIVIPFLLAMSLTQKGRWRLLAAAALALCTLALFATKARTGVVGVSIGGLVVLILYQLSQGIRGPRVAVAAASLVIVVGLGAGAFLLAIGTSPDATQRYSVLLTPEKDESVQVRFDKWRDGMRQVRQHPLGQGLGAAGEAHTRFGRFLTVASAELDNSYLQIAWEQGFSVMLLYIGALLLVLLGLARRAVLTTSGLKSGLALGACGTLTSFALIMISGPFIQGLAALAAWTVVGLGVGQFTTSPPD